MNLNYSSRAKIFDDMDLSHITEPEMNAIKTILGSDRAAVLTQELVNQFAELDSSAITWLVNILVGVIQKMTAKTAHTIDSMVSWVNTLGRKLTIDKVTSGSRKGEPVFLTKHYRDLTDTNNWDVMVYMYHFCNFQKGALKFEAGVYSSMPTAGSHCAANKLAASYVGRFVKMLDYMKTKPLDDLLPTKMFFDEYPEAKEMLDWCIKNRDKWDDFKEYCEANYEKGQLY